MLFRSAYSFDVVLDEYSHVVQWAVFDCLSIAGGEHRLDRDGRVAAVDFMKTGKELLAINGVIGHALTMTRNHD